MKIFKNTINIKNPLEFWSLLRKLSLRLNRSITKIYIFLLNIDGLFAIRKKTTDEKIIVSMTSWKKRINNVETVVKTILNNTIKPDIIICNLSIDEFPMKEKELPINLLELQNNTIFEINWVKENNKAFKKFIPTLKKYPNDIIITIDDDFIYPPYFIETFYKKHLEKPNTPLSGNNIVINYANFHCGCASLVKANYFGKYIDLFYDDEVLSLGASDVFYTYCAAMNGFYYENVGKEFFTNMPTFSAIDALSETDGLQLYEMMDLMKTKILIKYKIDFSNLKKPKIKLF